MDERIKNMDLENCKARLIGAVRIALFTPGALNKWMIPVDVVVLFVCMALG